MLMCFNNVGVFRGNWYQPPNNIYYSPGSTCGACPDDCDDGLCTIEVRGTECLEGATTGDLYPVKQSLNTRYNTVAAGVTTPPPEPPTPPSRRFIDHEHIGRDIVQGDRDRILEAHNKCVASGNTTKRRFLASEWFLS